MNLLPTHLAVPWLPWLLLALPILAIVGIIQRARRRRMLARFAQPLALALLLPPPAQWRWLKALTASLGMTCLIIASSGPRWGQGKPPEIVPGRDIVIVLDMSRSMLATDAPPNRFERGRHAVLELVAAIRERGGHRLSVVAFAGDAQVVTPLTYDYAHVRQKIGALDIEFSPSKLRPRAELTSGTRLGAALQLAVAAHDPHAAGFQDVIVISDGDDPLGDANWQEGLRAAAAAEIPMHTVGIGDPERGSAVPGRPGAETRLHEHPLREIARQTGGHYLAAHREAPRLIEFFEQRIQPKPGAAPAAVLSPQPRSQQLWFYLAALVLLAATWVVGYFD